MNSINILRITAGSMPPRGNRLWYAMLFASLCTGSASCDETIDYNRQIRPLLSDRCFQCHGPDEAHREAGLRLDEVKAATSESDSGYIAIVPGDLGASELVARIASDDADLVMPPVHSGKSLNEDEIELLKRWVKQGAEYQPHWSFIPPKATPPREVQREAWPAGEIDRYVLAKLESSGREPAPDADKVTLLRRVTLDLTGLPPTREEVADFLSDDSPGAYEKVIDRLLDSPRYGEHMARYWLDAVRYGDTHGLHLDNYREMWPYRDWVVRAFNANLPWDQFITMQVAGDLLPEATLDDRIASGFNRCNITTSEGGSIEEEVHIRNVVDRVSTTGTVFMGLTMGCAVCHDHKFDPVTMRDFYAMSAFFNNVDGNPLDKNLPDPPPVMKVPTPEQSEQQASLNQQLEELEEQLASAMDEVDADQQKWEETLREEWANGGEPKIQWGDWYSIGPFLGNSNDLYSQHDGPEGKPIDLEQQFNNTKGELLAWVVRPEWDDGKTHLALDEQVSATLLYRTIESNSDQVLTIGLGTDDGVKVYLNDEQIHEVHNARAVRAEQDKIELKLKEGVNHLLLKIVNSGGRSGFHFTTSTEEARLPDVIQQSLAIEPEQRTEQQLKALRLHYREQVSNHPDVTRSLEERESLRQGLTKLEAAIPTTLVMKERAEPRPAYVLLRGQYDAPDKELGPLARRVPDFLPPLPDDAPRDRLGFAQWLVSADQPLMARVTVNRFWQQFFGTGLVETADDFGSQGSWPSHPALLDWLAIDFRQHDWDVQRLLKQIVLSRTYRQSSKTTPELTAVDPRNRLLARGPRYRLEAEVIRDQALAVSGLLVNKLGGPSVKPPQPAGLWAAVAYSSSNTNKFVADEGPEKVHRRSMYTFWKRTSPPPQMTTLDAPSRESCVVRRERTNTPLAALLLLNDSQFFEASRKLAERAMLEAGGNPRHVAVTILQLATLREATHDEVARLVALFNTTLARYRADESSRDKMLKVGAASIDPMVDRTELAAWTLVANAVLNLDEVLNKE